MKYIQELIDYVNENIYEIEVPGHKLFNSFNISESKIKKDFRATQGETLLNYLIRKKVELAAKLKSENSDLTLQDLLTKINYNYTERSFRNHIKKFLPGTNGCSMFDGEPIDEKELKSGLSIFGPYYYQNQNVLEEILIRLILLIDEPEIEKDTPDCFIIKHNVKDTIFQFNYLFSLEELHMHEVFLDISDLTLDYFLIIQQEINKNEASILNNLTPYFSLIYNLNNRLEDQLGFSLLKAIENWDNYVKSVQTIRFGEEFYNLEVDLSSHPNIKINPDSAFIQKTNKIKENLKNDLAKSCKNAIYEKFGITYDRINQYIKHVEKDNYTQMAEFLRQENLSNKTLLEFLVNLTEFPLLENLYLHDYSPEVDDDILEVLAGHKKEKIITTLIEFKKKRDLLTDEEFEEYDINDCLRDIIPI